MKLINATIVSIAALTLGACAVSIEGGQGHHTNYDRDNYISVKLQSGERAEFSCPAEMEVFVHNRVDEGKGLVYGCRSKGTSTEYTVE